MWSGSEEIRQSNCNIGINCYADLLFSSLLALLTNTYTSVYSCVLFIVYTRIKLNNRGVKSKANLYSLIRRIFTEKILTFPGSVGSFGDSQTLFLALVEDGDRVGGGGGLVTEVCSKFTEFSWLLNSVADPDPYPYVFGPHKSGSVVCTRYTDPDYSIIKQNSKKTLIPTVLWLLYDFLSLKNGVNEASKSNTR